MEKNILALDLGTNTGWAVKDDNSIYSGVWELYPAKNRRFENEYVRYKRFKDELNYMVSTFNFEYIVFERVQQRQPSVAADHVYGAFLAYLMETATESDTPCLGIAVSTIKKHITGTGNAGKDLVVKAVEKKFGKKVATHDEADALALLDYAMKNNVFKVK